MINYVLFIVHIYLFLLSIHVLQSCVILYSVIQTEEEIQKVNVQTIWGHLSMTYADALRSRGSSGHDGGSMGGGGRRSGHGQGGRRSGHGHGGRRRGGRGRS